MRAIANSYLKLLTPSQLKIIVLELLGIQRDGMALGLASTRDKDALRLRHLFIATQSTDTLETKHEKEIEMKVKK